jgi:hypothetical protein
MGAKHPIESSRKVQSLFDPKSLGESFKEMAIDYIETEDSNLQSRWFQSEWDADLFIWTDVNKRPESFQDEMIKYQISFFGQIVEWSIFDGVRTGLIVENENSGEPTSELIEFDQVPQEKSIQQARHILSFMGPLTTEEQNQMIQGLSENVKSMKCVIKQKSKSPKASFQGLLSWIQKIKK